MRPNNRYFAIGKYTRRVDFIYTLQPLHSNNDTRCYHFKHRIENCTVEGTSIIRAGITLVIRLAKRSGDFETPPNIFKWYEKITR